MTISRNTASPGSTTVTFDVSGIPPDPDSSPRVLIIGYGKMGRIHARHLTELGATWNFHDPHVPGGVGLDGLNQVTHIIIATPIATHAAVFRQLDQYAGPILIEKPVVVQREDLDVLADPRVSAGMCERFNPVIAWLRKHVAVTEIRSLSFCRTSPIGDLADIGIHDLDLFCHVIGLDHVPEYRWDRDKLVAPSDGIRGEFHWPTSPVRQRTLRVETNHYSFEIDLLNQQISGSPVPFEPPVKRELAAFLKGGRADASVAHQWLVELVGPRASNI